MLPYPSGLARLGWPSLVLFSRCFQCERGLMCLRSGACKAVRRTHMLMYAPARSHTLTHLHLRARCLLVSAIFHPSTPHLSPLPPASACARTRTWTRRRRSGRARGAAATTARAPRRCRCDDCAAWHQPGRGGRGPLLSLARPPLRWQLAGADQNFLFRYSAIHSPTCLHAYKRKNAAYVCRRATT